MKDVLVFSFNPNLDYLDLMNSICREVSNLWGLDSQKTNKLESCVMESVVNSIKNYDSIDDELIRLKFTRRTELIEVEIKNPGIKILDSSFNEPDLEHHKENGYGLFIIKSLADQFQYRYEGGQNIFDLKFNL